MSAPTIDKLQLQQVLVDSGALLAGDFVLKSGKKSSWFLNVGNISQAAHLQILAQNYATLLQQVMVDYKVNALFGSAYKGIGLAYITALSTMDTHPGLSDLQVLYNRKEVKDHGEGGTIVGGEPKGQIVLIDDVLSAGTATRETLAQLAHYPKAQVVAQLVLLDRRENKSASQFDFPIYSMLELEDMQAMVR